MTRVTITIEHEGNTITSTGELPEELLLLAASHGPMSLAGACMGTVTQACRELWREMRDEHQEEKGEIR